MSVPPTMHVASGEFRVATAGREALTACLGTCIGVAIVDRHARVGGLYHILVPDAVSGPECDRAVSAATGMPLFLEALHEAGCSSRRMQATVAGGALMGSVSKLDLELDIGGRIVDIVNQRLKDAAIPVSHSETGGHFGSKLTLILQTLSCRLEPLVVQTLSTGIRPAPLTADELDRACARVRPVPQAALKIIRTMQSDDYSLAVLPWRSVGIR